MLHLLRYQILDINNFFVMQLVRLLCQPFGILVQLIYILLMLIKLLFSVRFQSLGVDAFIFDSRILVQVFSSLFQLSLYKIIVLFFKLVAYFVYLQIDMLFFLNLFPIIFVLQKLGKLLVNILLEVKDNNVLVTLVHISGLFVLKSNITCTTTKIRATRRSNIRLVGFSSNLYALISPYNWIPPTLPCIAFITGVLYDHSLNVDWRIPCLLCCGGLVDGGDEINRCFFLDRVHLKLIFAVAAAVVLQVYLILGGKAFVWLVEGFLLVA